MLQRLIGFFVVIVLASMVLGQDRPKVIPEREQERIKADKAAKAALQHRIANLDFTDTSLRDAIDFLRDVSGANIHVNWRAIDRAGIDPRTKLNIHLRDISMEKALNLVLNDSGNSEGELAWGLDSGVIEISTADLLRDVTCIRIYDIRDLLDRRGLDQAKELVDLVVETISPSDWVQNGGKSTIRFYNGEFIISANPNTQQGVEKLLDGLREFTSARVQK